jgi:hypothetical protein
MESTELFWIYESGIVQFMKEHAIDVEGAVSGNRSLARSSFWYPDGSLEIVGEENFRLFEDAVGSFRVRLRETPLESPWRFGHTTFFSLMHHAPSYYDVTVYGDWVLRLDDGSLPISGERGLHQAPGAATFEAPPTRTIVTLEFVQKIRSTALESIAACLRHTFSTVEKSGIDEEGPLVGPNHARVSAKAIQFRMDTLLTGRRTIVWFILSLLQVCKVAPLEVISFLENVAVGEGYPPRFALQSWEQHCGPFDRSINLMPPRHDVAL